MHVGANKKFHLNITFVKVVEGQNRKAVESPALKTFKTQPEAAQRNLL